MFTTLQSEIIFRKHFICWQILGFLPTQNHHKIYMVYSILLNLIITIIYPIHLIIGLFQSKAMYDMIKNLAVVSTVIVCSIKTFVIWLKFKNIENMFDIIKRQDKRIILNKEECYYYERITFTNIRLILKLFITLYGSAWLLGELMVLFNGIMGNWNLLYSAYFPFDPFASTEWYIVAHIYQFIGASVLILQNTVNDSFVAMHLSLLSGQIHTFNMRLTKLGQDKDKLNELHNQELLECIQDHKDLLE